MKLRLRLIFMWICMYEIWTYARSSDVNNFFFYLEVNDDNRDTRATTTSLENAHPLGS